MSLNLDFSDISLGLDVGPTVLVGLPQEGCFLTAWTCPITGDVTFEHLLTMVSDAS